MMIGGDCMEKWLTVADLAKETNIPDSTCRRYLSTFEAFFLVKGGSRSKKYERQAVDILKRIKHLYDEGLETNEIHNVLMNEFPIVVDDDKQGEDVATVTPTLATSEDIAEIKAALEEQKRFNQILLERLEQQQKYIKEHLERRDQVLLQSIRELQQQKQAMLETSADTQQKKKRKGILKRLFSRD